MPSALYAFIVGFIVLNAVVGMVTYVTLLERKFAARMQSRIGPYRVGPHGLLQPIADAVKLMMKEDIVPRLADRTVYNLAPIVFLVPCMLIFATLPFAPGLGVADLNRSEEHTSELQSLTNLVCRLLLEKKKRKSG